MTKIEALVSRLVDDEKTSRVIGVWRDGLKAEMGRKDFRKFIRHLNMVGVALQVEDDRVVNCICLDEVNDEVLLGMRGSGWLVYEGVVSKPGNRGFKTGWSPQTGECVDDVDVQKRKGYSRKYRHGNHRQVVKASWRRVVEEMRGK